MIDETIGSYHILSRLGAGAMGEVYLAEHRHLKRKVAIKLLARELVARPDLIERFFLEARATSAIAHPGIVQIFDCELDPTGRPYIVMEYLAGDTLGALLKRGPLSAVTAVRLARAMADALGAAHATGIVHRDLKPDNVFVLAQPPDAIKLVDFGIAKLAGDFQAGQVHRTRSGAMMGTPLYMSPEQCRDSAAIDFRTDIYSLGCVFFEMLTGRPPFTQDALGDLIVAHMTAPPPEAREVAPSVPQQLAELVAALLRKNPVERPESMAAVSERLAAFLRGATTSRDGGLAEVPAPAVPPARTTFGATAAEQIVPAQDELGQPKPRRARPAIIGGAAVLALALGAFVVARTGPSPETRPPAASPAGMPAPEKTTMAKQEPPAGPPVAAPAAVSTAPSVAPSTVGASRRRVQTPPSRKVGRRPDREADEAAPAAPPAPAAAASPPAVEAASDEDLAGFWEGPWTDAEHRQDGRLYLQIGGDGAVTGWMFNRNANQTFRLGGRLSRSGYLDLSCQCPPQQIFLARGTVRMRGGELRGDLTLSSATGAFGRSRLALNRTTARH